MACTEMGQGVASKVDRRRLLKKREVDILEGRMVGLLSDLLIIKDRSRRKGGNRRSSCTEK